MKKPAEYIRWTEYPTEHAMLAYRKGFFLEAIQVLHGFLEAKMRDLLMVSRHGNIRGGYGEIWDVTQEMSFNILAKALFVAGKLTQKEYRALQRFNSTRNKLVHRFFWEPSEKEYKGIPRSDYDKVFQTGIGLVDKMDAKAGHLLSRRGGPTRRST